MTDSTTAGSTAPPDSQPLTAPAAEESRTTTEGGDRLRHIICIVCYPAFAGAGEAPSDAVCICGRPVRRGDRRNPADAVQCVMCNELRGHHDRTTHPT